MSNNDKFVFNYSAKQQKEVDSIREKYIHKKETKLDEMRKLDQAVTKKATMITIIVGVIATLLLGVGMCCTMVWQETMFYPGIVIGIVGIGGIAISVPMYNYLIAQERNKIAEQIIKLSEEFENETKAQGSLNE